MLWLLLLAAAPAGVPANPDPALVPAGHYSVEPHHTRVQFTVSHMGFTDWYGDFSGVSGRLELDPAHPDAAQVEIAIPVASVSTTNAKLDEELKSADWLDAGRYPAIRFTSRRVVRTGSIQARIEGDLTLHGVTRPVTLSASFNGAGTDPIEKHYVAGFNATTSIRRSDFGVANYVPLVGDELAIRISAAFVKK